MKWLRLIVAPFRVAVWQVFLLLRPIITGVLGILVFCGTVGIVVFGISWYMAEVPSSVTLARNLFLTSIGQIVVFGPLIAAYDKLLFWLEPKDRQIFYT